MSNRFEQKVIAIFIHLTLLSFNNLFSQDIVLYQYDLDSNLYKQIELVNGNKIEYYYDLNGNRFDSILTDSMKQDLRFIEIRKKVANAAYLPEGLYRKDSDPDIFEISFSIIVEKDGRITNFRLLSGINRNLKQKDILQYYPIFDSIEPFYLDGKSPRYELIGTIFMSNSLPILREEKPLNYKF